MSTDIISRCAAVMDLIDSYVGSQTSDNRHAIRSALLALASAPAQPLAWIYEDELPKGYPYEAMFPYSKVDGVRMFPVYGPSAPAQPVAMTDEQIREHLSRFLPEGATGPGGGKWIAPHWLLEAVRALSAQPEAKAQAVPENVTITLPRKVALQLLNTQIETVHGLIEDAFGAGPQPPAPSEPELIYCKYCQGSGESTHVVGSGPDAHDEPCNCDKCGGTGVFQAGRVVDVGLLEYRGNSVAHIHSKMTAYRSGLDAAWEALKKVGIRPDGNTSVAMGIERLAAPSEQRKPLTDDRLEVLWEDYVYGTFQGVPQDPDYKGFARAIEAAHGIRSTGGDHE